MISSTWGRDRMPLALRTWRQTRREGDEASPPAPPAAAAERLLGETRRAQELRLPTNDIRESLNGAVQKVSLRVFPEPVSKTFIFYRLFKASSYS